MGQAGSPSSALPSDQKPDVMYADIGGMDIQKQEVREAVELPLTHFELYKQVRSRDRKGPTEFQVGDRTPWLILSPPLLFRLASILPEASSCTARLAVGRRCWQRLWLITPPVSHSGPPASSDLLGNSDLAPCSLILFRKWHSTVIKNMGSGVRAPLCFLLIGCAVLDRLL